jgi:hypothetical protein
MNITVDVVRGESAAKRAVENYDSKLTDNERYAGVRHFSQRTTKRTWAKAERRVVAYNPESAAALQVGLGGALVFITGDSLENRKPSAGKSWCRHASGHGAGIALWLPSSARMRNAMIHGHREIEFK